MKRFWLLYIIGLLMISSCDFFNDKEERKIDYNQMFSGTIVQEIKGDDYSFLSSIPKSTKIIGLGESVHGSKEFDELRFNSFKYLVANHQYNVFLVEGDFGAFLPISKYIETGEGNPEKLLAQSGYWTWNTLEMLDIIKWMRAYNADASNKEKLSMYGVDMKFTYGILRYIVSYYSDHSSKNSSHIIQKSKDLYVFKTNTPNYRDSLIALANLIDKENQTAQKAEKTGNYNSLIQICPSVLKQRAEILAIPNSKKKKITLLRDEFLAKNIVDLMDLVGKNSKGLFAAHNFHLNKYKYNLTERIFENPKCGKYLNDAYGANYFAIYVDFASGTTRAFSKSASGLPALQETKIDLNPQTISCQFFKNNRPSFFVNLHTIGPEKSDTLASEIVFNDLGSTDKKDPFRPLSLSKQFDGYLYLPQITVSSPNDDWDNSIIFRTLGK